MFSRQSRNTCSSSHHHDPHATEGLQREYREHSLLHLFLLLQRRQLAELQNRQQHHRRFSRAAHHAQLQIGRPPTVRTGGHSGRASLQKNHRRAVDHEHCHQKRVHRAFAPRKTLPQRSTRFKFSSRNIRSLFVGQLQRKRNFLFLRRRLKRGIVFQIVLWAQDLLQEVVQPIQISRWERCEQSQMRLRLQDQPVIGWFNGGKILHRSSRGNRLGWPLIGPLGLPTGGTNNTGGAADGTGS